MANLGVLPPPVNSALFNVTEGQSLFTPMPTEFNRISCFSVQGQEGSGKTDFALSGPAPIAYINIDGGNWKRVRLRYPDKDIRIVDIEAPDIPDGANADYIQNLFTPTYRKLKNAFVGALSDPEIRTVVVDTMTMGWYLARLASIGKLKVKAIHYDEVNADFRRLIRQAEKFNKVVFLLHREKDGYNEEGQKSGGFDRAGFSEIPNEVQDLLRCSKNSKNEFCVEITNSKTRPQLTGQIFTPADGNSFPDIAMRLWPDSLPTDWI